MQRPARAQWSFDFITTIGRIALTTINRIAITTISRIAITTIDIIAITTINRIAITTINMIAITTINIIANNSSYTPPVMLRVDPRSFQTCTAYLAPAKRVLGPVGT